MEHLWEREGRRNGGLTDERTVPSFRGFYRLEQTRFFYTSHTLKVRLPGSYINISNMSLQHFAIAKRQMSYLPRGSSSTPFGLGELEGKPHEETDRPKTAIERGVKNPPSAHRSGTREGGMPCSSCKGCNWGGRKQQLCNHPVFRPH